MSTTLLCTFDDAESRERFINIIKTYAKTLSKSQSTSPDGIFLQQVLKNIKADPQLKTDADRTAGLFVSGKKLCTGNVLEMRKRFKQELAAHSGNVEIKELRDGAWTTIMSRKLQK